MKKLVRLIPPINLFVNLAITLAGLAMLAFTIKKLASGYDAATLIFFLFVLLGVVAMVLVNVSLAKTGVLFTDEHFEFTQLDDNNVFAYSDVASITMQLNNSWALKKSYYDKCTLITIESTAGSLTEIDLGQITRRKAKKLCAAFAEYNLHVAVH